MDSISYGLPDNYWTWTSSTNGYDLSRGRCGPNSLKTFSSHKGPVTINPAASALIIVDLQNYFLHPAIRDHPGGLRVADVLVERVIPCARAAGLKIIWLNWGLTNEDIVSLPPTHAASFGAVPTLASKTGLPGGLGADLGVIAGVPAGRRLMRGTWNVELYGALKHVWEEGDKAGTDFWIHKNRLSGIWSDTSQLHLFLQENGIDTLFFTGVNTDQCVWGTLIDAHNKGYDTVFVKDCVATTSPAFCTEATEFNASITSFLCTSGDLQQAFTASTL